MIKPLEDIVVVAPSPPRTSIEMLRPDLCLRGRVLAVGPGVVICGMRIPSYVNVGDIVHLAPGKNVEAVFDNKRVWITRERELLAVEE